MSNHLDKTSLAFLKNEVLSPLVRFRKLNAEGKHLVRSIQRALNNPEAAITIQRMRDAIFLQPNEKKVGRTVGFAGPVGKEGTTSLAILLGLTLGELRRNRVVFIDGRLEKHTFSLYTELFGLTKNALNHQNGNGYFHCYSTKNQNLCFLSPSSGMQAVELFSTEEVSHLVEDLRAVFDYIIFDMPPVLNSSESRLLIPHLDVFFLVCAACKTQISDAMKARELVAELGGSINGVILNKQKVPLWTALFGREAFF